MRYYLIVSSKLDMSALDIINKYHNLTKIENEFRILKSTLNTRPMFVRKKNIYICTYNNMFYFIIDFKPYTKKGFKICKRK